MSYTFKGEYREGVVFAFIDKKKRILVEHRLVDKCNETFLTSGSIELKDYNSEKDYKLVALYREVREEFENKIQIKNAEYIQDIIVNDINVIFYVYLITEWEGVMPEHTVEEGRIHAKLEWVSLSDADKVFTFKSGKDICKGIENYLTK